MVYRGGCGPISTGTSVSAVIYQIARPAARSLCQNPRFIYTICRQDSPIPSPRSASKHPAHPLEELPLNRPTETLSLPVVLIPLALACLASPAEQGRTSSDNSPPPPRKAASSTQARLGSSIITRHERLPRLGAAPRWRDAGSGEPRRRPPDCHVHHPGADVVLLHDLRGLASLCEDCDSRLALELG